MTEAQTKGERMHTPDAKCTRPSPPATPMKEEGDSTPRGSQSMRARNQDVSRSPPSATPRCIQEGGP